MNYYIQVSTSVQQESLIERVSQHSNRLRLWTLREGQGGLASPRGDGIVALEVGQPTTYTSPKFHKLALLVFVNMQGFAHIIY